MRPIKFHQGFKLDRLRLATLMRCAVENPIITKIVASKYMGVGAPAAEGCIGWLIKVGFGEVTAKGYRLTPLGSLIAEHDPELTQQSTLWLMHYYLVSDHNERAEIWYRAFNDFLHPGQSFHRDTLLTYVERSLEILPTNSTGLRDDCNAFGTCYTDPAALVKLDLVREVAPKTYTGGLTAFPAPSVVAFTLFDAWQRRFPHTDTLRISQICEEPELTGKVFAARRDQVVQMLQILQSLGMVNIVDSQHEPVTRRYRDDPQALLGHFYTAL